MVDLLERTEVLPKLPRAQAEPVIFGEELFLIPAVLPPRLSLNPQRERIDTNLDDLEHKSPGFVEITIRNSKKRLETYYGRVTYYDSSKGDVRVSFWNKHGSYAHIKQEDGITEVWFDRSARVIRNEASLNEEHPLFAHMIREIALFNLEYGKKNEPQAYACLGPVDFWGFLRGNNRIIVDQAIDKAA